MAEGLAVGATIAERYVVEAQIGSGGIAEVYRVRHTELGSVHALKVLTWRRQSLADRFLREGKFQARLGHPNVVTVTDIVRFDGQVALIMEYIDGITLEQFLADHGAMPVHEAFALFVPVLAAVAAAHDRGVLHRDLKPANVLLASTPVGWVPKVADFGIAKFVEEELAGDTTAGMVMGSPGYMAPEQIRDSSTVDRRADVFALGAILYEMLAGRRAFVDADGGVSIATTLDREPPQLEVPGVDAEVAAAIRRAMARDREERFPDCRAFARALGVGAHPLLLDLADRSAAPSFDRGFASPYVPSTLSGRSPAAPLGSAPSSVTQRPWLVLSFATVGTIVALVALIVAVVGVLGFGVAVARWSAPEDPAIAPIAPVADGARTQPRPGPADVEGAEAPPEPERSATPAEGQPAPVPGEPGPTEPGPTEPGPTEPGPTEPGPTEPGPAEPGPAEPGPTEPGPTEPGPTEPGPAPEPATTEPEPDAVAAVAPEPAPRPLPAPARAVDLSGSWKGRADGRPFELRLTGAGTAWSGEAVFVFGANTRREALSGTFDPATGRLSLRAAGDGAVRFDGALTGGALSGTYQQGKGKPLPWSAAR